MDLMDIKISINKILNSINDCEMVVKTQNDVKSKYLLKEFEFQKEELKKQKELIDIVCNITVNDIHQTLKIIGGD